MPVYRVPLVLELDYVGSADEAYAIASNWVRSKRDPRLIIGPRDLVEEWADAPSAPVVR
jgi:hypothetical protein